MAIEHARNDKGLTREDLAERIRKSERYVVAIERGERTPSLKTCYQIVRCLGISAFANSFGGHIVFGVRDNPREVCGLDNPQEVISKITELIKARIDPTPRYQLHAFAEDDKIYIDLEIQNSPAYPY